MREKGREGRRVGLSTVRVSTVCVKGVLFHGFPSSSRQRAASNVPSATFPHSFIHLSSALRHRGENAFGEASWISSTALGEQLALPLRALRWRGSGKDRSAWCSSSGGRRAVWRWRMAGKIADGSGESEWAVLEERITSTNNLVEECHADAESRWHSQWWYQCCKCVGMPWWQQQLTWICSASWPQLLDWPQWPVDSVQTNAKTKEKDKKSFQPFVIHLGCLKIKVEA